MNLYCELFDINYLNSLKYWPYTVHWPSLSEMANPFLQTQGALLILSFTPSGPKSL